MAVTTIEIQNRSETGTNAVNKMRVEKMIPGVIYSRGEDNIHITVEEAEFSRAYRIAGSTSLLGLNLDGERIPAIIKEIQSHPYKNEILHVDFQKINMDEKIRMTVPIVLVNREDIQNKDAVLMQLLDEIEIECLPGDIPSSIDVNVEDMDLDTPIAVDDLDIAKNEDVTILTETDQVVCTLTLPTLEEEIDEEELEEGAEPELVGQEDSEEESEE